jgi:hypothetical protein
VSLRIHADLHGHTIFSDGRATPEEFVEDRRAAGVRVVAFADHDVMAGVRRGSIAAQRAGMLFVPAMEVTSFVHFGTARAEQIHVLAYYPPELLRGPRLEQRALYLRGLDVQRRWREFALEWIASLEPADRAALDPDGALAAQPPADFPALQSFIDLVVARRPDCFEPLRLHHVRFWTEDRARFGWTPFEAIDAIRADGAIDVVAHAARHADQDEVSRVLAYATGVEVYTRHHPPADAARLLAWAEANGKLWTSSTDDHQRAKYQPPQAGTSVQMLERILRRPLPQSLVMSTFLG